MSHPINSPHENGRALGDGFGMTAEAKAEQLDGQPVIDCRRPVKIQPDAYAEEGIWRCKCGHDHEYEPLVLIGDETAQRCEACGAYDMIARVEDETPVLVTPPRRNRTRVWVYRCDCECAMSWRIHTHEPKHGETSPCPHCATFVPLILDAKETEAQNHQGAWVCTVCFESSPELVLKPYGDESYTYCPSCRRLESMISRVSVKAEPFHPRTGDCRESTGGLSPTSESPVPNSNDEGAA